MVSKWVPQPQCRGTGLLHWSLNNHQCLAILTYYSDVGMVPSRFWYSPGKVPNTFNAASLGLYSSWKCRKIWPCCSQTNMYGYKVIVGPVWKLGYFVLWYNLTLIPPYMPPHKITNHSASINAVRKSATQIPTTLKGWDPPWCNALGS